MKFKLELEFDNLDHLRMVAIIAALLDEGDGAFDCSGIRAVDLISAIDYICCNSYVTDEDIEMWLDEQIASNNLGVPDPRVREWWKQTLRVRLHRHTKENVQIHDGSN